VFNWLRGNIASIGMTPDTWEIVLAIVHNVYLTAMGDEDLAALQTLFDSIGVGRSVESSTMPQHRSKTPLRSFKTAQNIQFRPMRASLGL